MQKLGAQTKSVILDSRTMTEEIKIGSTAFLYNVNVNVQGNHELKKVTVTKIGRKWITFETDYGLKYQFGFDGTENSDYSHNTLYASQKSYDDRVLASKIWDKVKQLAQLIADKIKGAFSFLRPARSVGDVIIRPNGQVIEPDPKDTIIATKNPGGMGGGNITLNFNGLTSDELMSVIKRELGVDVFRSSRF